MENEILKEQEPKVAGQFLKILTVLTFIGCASMAFQSISFAMNPDAQLLQMEKRIAMEEEKGRSGFFMDMSYKGLEMMRVRKENLPLLPIIDLVGVALCAFGAFQMRKLNKIGYWSWLLGEFVPWIIGVIIIGNVMLEPIFLSVLIAPIAFAIMYGTQLKHMD